jgi:Fur family transcriptional regulator, ferric uptake regulator
MRRQTNQRNAIQEVFKRKDQPMAIGEVLEGGRQFVETLNLATVYRNLKLLVARGWLKRINAPDLGTLYERAGKEHHHHFQCRSCDRLFELPGCSLKPDLPAPPGFVIEEHEVFLFGICSSCSG